MDGQRTDRLEFRERKKLDTRSPFEIDGDRILYAPAYRRLAGVTQVVWPQEQQIFHNRLTHTLEVTQVARRIAQYLCAIDGKLSGIVDPDVVTAAAMAHDLGHPPFAHIGEVTLNQLIRKDTKKKEGFEGNAQSFRIVTKLALRNKDTCGLNLTRATLGAMLKYPWMERDPLAMKKGKWGAYQSEREYFEFARKDFKGTKEKSIEAEIMDYADDIAYSVHDIFDFQRVGLLPIEQLQYDDEVFNEFFFFWGKDRAFEWPRDLKGKKYSPWNVIYDPQFSVTGKGEAANIYHRFLEEIYSNEQLLTADWPTKTMTELSSRLINRFITSAHVIYEGGKPYLKRNIESKGLRNPLATNENQIQFYKRITWHYLIKHARLASVQEGQKLIIQTLYKEYKKAILGKGEPAIIPGSMMPYLQEFYWEEKPKKRDSACRLAADIICMLTDSEAYAMFWRMTGQKMPGITDISIW